MLGKCRVSQKMQNEDLKVKRSVGYRVRGVQKVLRTAQH